MALYRYERNLSPRDGTTAVNLISQGQPVLVTMGQTVELSPSELDEVDNHFIFVPSTDPPVTVLSDSLLTALLVSPSVGDYLQYGEDGKWENVHAKNLKPFFDITKYGARPDRADNDVPIKEARAAAVAAGGGVVYGPAGLYPTVTSLDTWPDNVSLIGDGWGKTIFKPVGGIRFLEATRTAGTPLTNCRFSDFEVDGISQTGGTSKGFHIQHYKRCVFERLYVHDCGFTGIGPDHPQDHNVITQCLTENNGRLNDGTQSSGNGIGVGMSDTISEQPLTIIGNTAITNKRYGIFVESQSGSSSEMCSGVRIIGNYTRGGQIGIGDCGSRRTVIGLNQCTQASKAGIALDEGTFSGGQPGYGNVIQGNNCYANGGDGIRLDYSVGTVIGCQTTVQNNECSHNSLKGIHVLSATQDIFDLVMTENVCRFNARSGIGFMLTGGATAQLRWSNISRNTVLNNGSGGSAGDGDGIRINMIVNDTNVENNRTFDRQGTKTQDRGIHFNAAVNGGSVRNNDVRNNQTGTMFFSSAPSTTTALGGNLGYTPPNPASVTPGASPWTYTAGEVPELLRVFGGTVSNITLNGVQVATQTDQNLFLEPADAVIITYSSAPTVLSRKR